VLNFVNALALVNGDPVTSDDVRFSFERYRGASDDLLKDRVAAVEVLDPPCPLQAQAAVAADRRGGAVNPFGIKGP
jgi:hypothetical protein